MIRRALGWLAARFGTGEERDDEDDSGWFVPSPLDRSVREAHGASDDGERELAEVREQAERLEEGQRGG